MSAETADGAARAGARRNHRLTVMSRRRMLTTGLGVCVAAAVPVTAFPATAQPLQLLQAENTRWYSLDVNADGRADLVHLWSGGINTLRSRGNGTYELIREGWKPRSNYGMDVARTRWLPGDVGGDRRGDLLHLWSGGINTLHSRGDGTYPLLQEGWKPRTDYGMDVAGTRWLAGDVSGDRRTDLVHLWSGGINTLRSRGDGTYELIREGWKPRGNYNMNVATTRWLAGDVNSDGRADLVHLWSGGINTLRSRGNGTYELIREGWKPRDNYNMNADFRVLED